MTQPSNSHRQREATDCGRLSGPDGGSAGPTAHAWLGDGSVADRDGLHRTGVDGEIPLDLLQAAVLGLRHLAPEVGQTDSARRYRLGMPPAVALTKKFHEVVQDLKARAISRERPTAISRTLFVSGDPVLCLWLRGWQAHMT
jgi:hypothetical protein